MTTANPVAVPAFIPPGAARKQHFLKGWRLPAMILGFIAWWPIGLGLLTFFAWRHSMGCNMNRLMRRGRDRAREMISMPGMGSGNTAFDTYRSSVLERLEAERRALDAQHAEFSGFLAELRRAKDQDEFDRFMQARAQRG